MAKPQKCEHVACSCKAAEGQQYCSPYCENAGSHSAGACACGYSGCEG